MKRQYVKFLLPLIVFAVAPLMAQDVPKRPDLGDQADTNSARAYYDWGMSRIERDPKKATDAFYWASRIAPEWAAPLYARRIAGLLSNTRRLIRYMEGRKSTLRSDEIRRLDSLEFRARQLDPFMHRNLDRLLIQTYLNESIMQDLRRRYRTSAVEDLRGQVDFVVERYLNSESGVEMRAWRAYSAGQFNQALGYYAEALDHTEDKAGVYAQRGRIFYLMQRHDSAAVSLSKALELRREQDEDDLVFLYESKAMLEYSLGMVFEAAAKLDEAREAYARALVEDLAFHPAHVQLGRLALAAGDSATALSEFELAAEINPNAIGPRAMLGELLVAAERPNDAVVHLQRANELDPYYAQPYLTLALTNEALGDNDAAIACYEDFMARALATDQRRGPVAQRIVALRNQ
jgi:tetratricopeptide (TPR) repeat protein